MALLSELLSGKRVDVRGGLTEVDASSLSNAWRTLRASTPSVVEVTPAEIAANEAVQAAYLGKAA